MPTSKRHANRPREKAKAVCAARLLGANAAQLRAAKRDKVLGAMAAKALVAAAIAKVGVMVGVIFRAKNAKNAKIGKGVQIVQPASRAVLMAMTNSANAASATKARLKPKRHAKRFSLAITKCPTSSKPSAVVQGGAVIRVAAKAARAV